MSSDSPTVVRTAHGKVPSIHVNYVDSSGAHHSKEFDQSFVIGRDEDCDLLIDDDSVSRHHIKIIFDNGTWFIKDLNSTNGTFVNRKRVFAQRLVGAAHVQLGNNGPNVYLTVGKPTEQSPKSLGFSRNSHDIDRYVDIYYDGPMGEFTQFVRKAVTERVKQQSHEYMYVVLIIGALLIVALSYAAYQQYHINQLDKIAVDIFYSMKEIELQMSIQENNLASNATKDDRERIAKLRQKLTNMESEYNTYQLNTGLFGSALSEEDQLIFRVARIFGECEINLPKDFSDEVKKYIDKWKSSNRLSEAVKRAQLNGYVDIIRKEMRQNYLPPQFFYLALQESDFKRNSVGPKTRYGFAKGIWQFIPSTARQYGLETGPLVEMGQFDPKDERFDFDKSTKAAASYIREIYTTDAQASGLLVIASYNWGEHRIIERIRELPNNPRERNFWMLLKQHDLPKETYDYVYYIFSAAVIGENPRLFGFDFDNPLVEN